MFETLGMRSSDKPCSTVDTLIGAKTELKGDISFSGGLRIDGKIRGDVVAKGEGNSTLVLSEHAVVIGDVVAPHLIVNGTIKGNIRAAESIELQSKADVTGDVVYKTIQIAAGAVLSGNLLREADTKGSVVTRLKPAEAGAPRKDLD
jgi:cytoskeletal protein CcmA (bactofilin family)